MCGASIITDDTLLTEAHCVTDFDYPPDKLVAYIGELDLLPVVQDYSPLQTIDVMRVHLHDMFTGIALYN